MIGTYALSSGYYDAYYGQAQRVRTLVRRDFDTAFAQVDLIVSPTSPTVAFGLGTRTADPLAMYQSDICTIPVNLAGLPAISIPCGLAGHLPVGFQLMGPAFSENRLLQRGPRPRRGDRLQRRADLHRLARRWRRAGDAGGRPPPAKTPPATGRRADRGALMSAWEPVIGLEVHVELDTATKMFCGCAVTKGDEPNTHTCPVCLAHPGALPVVNERAVEYAARIALALGCTVRPRSIFHRKNYFYPDLPKAYQISQYDEPLAVAGSFDYWVGEQKLSCRINRVHMEEDAAKLVHAGGEAGRIAGSDYSMVDFNRGGTPLIEIVGEPDIPSPEAAREFLQQLRNLVVGLGVSECNMEEGQIRWDANLSVRPAGSDRPRHAHRAQEHEQLPLPAAGPRGRVPAPGRRARSRRHASSQETLHFDPETGVTTPLRSKEEAHDYRYFPEPDLVPLTTDEAWIDAACAARCPSCPRPASSASAPSTGCRATTPRCSAAAAAMAGLLRRARRRGHRPQAGRQLGHGRVLGAPERRRPRARPRPRDRAAPGRAAAPRDRRPGLRHGGQAGLRLHGRRARRAGRHRGPPRPGARSPTRASSKPPWPRCSPHTPRRSSSTTPAKQALAGFFVGQVMKATQGKGNPQLVGELVRAALAGDERKGPA